MIAWVDTSTSPASPPAPPEAPKLRLVDTEPPSLEDKAPPPAPPPPPMDCAVNPLAPLPCVVMTTFRGLF